MTKFEECLKGEGIEAKDCNVHEIKLGDKLMYAMYSYPINEAVHGFLVLRVRSIMSTALNLDVYKAEDETMYRAELFMSGSIKWDGCSNWSFDIQTQGETYISNIHFCGEDQATLIGDIMRKAYDVTAEEMEIFEG